MTSVSAIGRRLLGELLAPRSGAPTRIWPSITDDALSLPQLKNLEGDVLVGTHSHGGDVSWL